MMNIELSPEMLEHQLNPDWTIPLCFASQETKQPSQSSASQLDLESSCLLSPSEFNSLDWKYSSEDSLSSQESCLDAVDIDLVSSMTYSPVSVPYQSNPASPMTAQSPSFNYAVSSPQVVVPEKTTADQLLEDYFPDVDKDDMLDGILDIMDQDQEVSPSPVYSSPLEDVLPRYIIVNNPPADSFALAMSSQYEEGVTLIEKPGYISQEIASHVIVKEDPEEPNLNSRGSSERKGKQVVKKVAPTGSKRGRKRKASDDGVSGDEKKRTQNAQAALNYRLRKKDEMEKIFEEKKQLESEVALTRKKFENKMNERNILLKMLYEAYIEEGSSIKKKIKFPDWLPIWYDKQRDM
jgi:hypothetical protein